MTINNDFLLTPRLILITGIMAAGKSTIAQRLAERLPKSVHLRGDLFRRMIISGRAEMGVELSPEALAQLRLRYELAALTTARYLATGFTVVYQDIIIGKGLLEVLPLHQGRPLHLVVLCPDPAVVAGREANRHKRGYGNADDIVNFDQVLRTETPRLGLWLDTSNLSVDETVEQILNGLAQARVETHDMA